MRRGALGTRQGRFTNGVKGPRSTVLSVEEEAIIVAFRRHTLLPLEDCLYSLQPTIPHLTRSSLHRCRRRHGISRRVEIEGEKGTDREPIHDQCLAQDVFEAQVHAKL
jgi:hypothetical protein